jgi:uncharacterized protein YggE
MKIKLLLATGLVLILISAGLAGCSSQRVTAADDQPITVIASNQQTGIWVSSQGTVTVTPDIATLNLGVYVQKDKVADAQSEAAAAMDKVMAALISNGVEKKDIQTRYFNIQQVTRWDSNNQQEIVIGYSVSNMVVAKVRTLDKVGAIIDAAVVAGGDLIRISGINFTTEDPSQYYAQARELAMNKAKAKAEQIAKLSGLTLGKVTYVSENSYNPPIPYLTNSYRSEMAIPVAAPTTSISPGQMEITLDIQVAYTLQ